MIDAGGHRIRRKLIGVTDERLKHEDRCGYAHRFAGDVRNGLMAEALTTVGATRSFLVRICFGVLCLFDLLICATIAHDIIPIARENEQ
jgi:hypothetical protein